METQPYVENADEHRSGYQAPQAHSSPRHFDTSPPIAQNPLQHTNDPSHLQQSQHHSPMHPKGSSLDNSIRCNGVHVEEIIVAPPVQTYEISSETERAIQPRPHNGSDQQPIEEKHESTKQEPSFMLNSDDFLTAGIPEEQYKPRPSRSRSSKPNLEQPIDYSVIPEKAGRRGTRRSKMIATANNASEPSTPEKVRQICEMGFTPETTQRVLVRTAGAASLLILADYCIVSNVLNSNHEPNRRGDSA